MNAISKLITLKEVLFIMNNTEKQNFFLKMLGIEIKEITVEYSNPNFTARNDCTTVALMKLLNKSYTDVLNIQLDLARQYELVRANFMGIIKWWS